MRRCSKTACGRSAAATLTYVYADSTAVLGPLSLRAEPGSYDLCETHSHGLSVPRGWEVIRLAIEEDPEPSVDDLLALANAVREIGLSYDPSPEPAKLMHPPGIVELNRRRHLTVLADPDA